MAAQAGGNRGRLDGRMLTDGTVENIETDQ
jgi:hypothetical protein